jgi:hypothetical protein
MSDRKPRQPISETKLSVVGNYTDVLVVHPDSILIETLDKNLEVAGRVELFTDHIPTKEDVDTIKAFYMQGQAVAQRKLSAIIDLFKSLGSPVIVVGPGDSPKEEGK